ncbi:MFS transporter [Streptomyces sp. NPDC059894]|uniref:MFS transporter n=1 Tax=unclassified Streptomyces TaxID=2593676 RepID=UPI0036693090
MPLGVSLPPVPGGASLGDVVRRLADLLEPGPDWCGRADTGIEDVAIAGPGEPLGTLPGAVLFPLLDTENYVLIAIALSGALLCMGIIYGPAGAYMPELFGTRMRYSGAGFSYNLGGVLGGAAAPLIVTALAENYSPVVGGWFMSGMALLSLLCVLALPETGGRDLDAI